MYRGTRFSVPRARHTQRVRSSSWKPEHTSHHSAADVVANPQAQLRSKRVAALQDVGSDKGNAIARRPPALREGGESASLLIAGTGLGAAQCRRARKRRDLRPGFGFLGFRLLLLPIASLLTICHGWSPSRLVAGEAAGGSTVRSNGFRAVGFGEAHEVLQHARNQRLSARVLSDRGSRKQPQQVARLRGGLAP